MLRLTCTLPAFARPRQYVPVTRKHDLDHRLHQGQVLQEAEPLAKSLCLVLALHAETELCVQRPQSGFETTQRFVGIE